MPAGRAYFVWIVAAILWGWLIHRVKLFTPCDDADNNEYGENSYRNQVALYIHIVKQGVEFFHNLNFSFKRV